MKHVLTALMVVGALMFLTASATADWGSTQPYKWVQFPDPNGWDVSFTWPVAGAPDLPLILADDFECKSPGPITDIHFWVSAQGDTQPTGSNPPFTIRGIKADIWTNEDLPVFSRPKDHLHGWDLAPGDFTVRWDGDGQQGFFTPLGGGVLDKGDHTNYYQVNIPKLDPPFLQAGTDTVPEIYWLSLEVDVQPGTTAPVTVGWKTAEEQWRDDAVVFDPIEAVWVPLFDPDTGQSLDLAFVITPEPSTIAMLLGAGLIGLVAYTRHRRKR